MKTFDQFIAMAQALSPEEKAALISLLWDNLSSEDWYPPSSDWTDEANRRSNAIDSGAMRCDSWENVRDRAMRTAGLIE